MFCDLDWPPNASHRFVSISWASCSLSLELITCAPCYHSSIKVAYWIVNMVQENQICGEISLLLTYQVIPCMCNANFSNKCGDLGTPIYFLQLKIDISYLVNILTTTSASHCVTITPKVGMVNVTWPNIRFCSPSMSSILWVNKAKHFKFYAKIDVVKIFVHRSKIRPENGQAWVTWPIFKYVTPSISLEWLKVDSSYLVLVFSTTTTVQIVTNNPSHGCGQNHRHQ